MIELTDTKIQKYLTPYRYEKPVLHGSGMLGAFDEKAVDIPFVFWHQNKYYMLYTGFDGKGYQSALATSDDLLHWEHKLTYSSLDIIAILAFHCQKESDSELVPVAASPTVVTIPSSLLVISFLFAFFSSLLILISLSRISSSRLAIRFF